MENLAASLFDGDGFGEIAWAVYVMSEFHGGVISQQLQLTAVYNRPMPSNKARRTLYIDLSNLYGGITELLPPGEYFDCSTIFPIVDAAFDQINSIKVYGAYLGQAGISDASRLLFVKAQNEFFNSAKLKGVHFGKGYISQHNKEKGVDMRLGVDLVHDAHSNDFDEAIIMSGDADFMYPVQFVRQLGKNVHYCAFATRFTFPIAFASNKRVVLDYKNYFANKILPNARRQPKGLKVIEIDGQVTVKNV